MPGNQELDELNNILKRIRKKILDSYTGTLKIPGVSKAIAGGDDGFFFRDDASALRELKKQVNDIAGNIDKLLHRGVTTSFAKGDKDLWSTLENNLGRVMKQQPAFFEGLKADATRSTRQSGGEAHYRALGPDGLSISDRVWNLSKNASKEMEIIIQNGIKEGKSADEVAKSIQGYLNEPDKLFRRVKNEKTGEMELSKAAQEYRPGQGVYRSAYANAMRLARTEMRKAYLEAQWQAAQSNPLITGWEIRLSNNHTTLRKGKKVELHDMCDELAGSYPKSFRFHGWHPNCRCNLLPILTTRAEQNDLYKKIADGKKEEFKPEGIKDVPQNFKEWIKDNQERAARAKRLPEFMRVNKGVVEKALDGLANEVKEIFALMPEKEYDNLMPTPVSVSEKDLLYSHGMGGGYIRTSNSMDINAYLSGRPLWNKPKITTDDLKVIDKLKEVIQRDSAKQNLLVSRKTEIKNLESIIGRQLKSLDGVVTGVGIDLKKLVDEINKIAGHTYENKGFTSASLIPERNVFNNRDTELIIQVRKGTNWFVTDNRVESEVILTPNSKFKIISAEEVNSGSVKLRITVRLLD